MIDWQHFKKAMSAISERCARPPGTEQLAMYYEFLSPKLTTEEFHQAAMAVWSSAEFFPPPVAFLEARAGREWDRLVELIARYTPPHVDAQWTEDWKALSEETRRTVSRLGGPLSFKERLFDFSVPKAYELFVDGYNAALRDSAARDMVVDQAERPMLQAGEGAA